MPRSSVVSTRLILICALTGTSFAAQNHFADQIRTAPVQLRNVQPPAPDATADDLEKQGDDLRAQKLYLDSIDYYRAALAKKPNAATLYNKIGIAELLTQRWQDSKKDFEHAIKADRSYADAYNNLGVIFYIGKKYGKAIDRYHKAIQLKDDAASYYSNLGAALFSKKEFEKSVLAYSHALQLDVIAKLYAKGGNPDRSIEYLRKALEEGYKSIDNVYKDEEFAGVRKDKRFTELMAVRPPAISD